VLSEARRGRPEARDWLRSVDADQVFLSVVTLGEIMKGLRLKTRSDAGAAAALHRWLETLRTEHARRILPVGDEVALEWGRIAALRPRNMADALIAATAAVHRKILVTRNVADFADLGLPLINPWDSNA
jgi:predicted nucleic acid-binding protein